MFTDWTQTDPSYFYIRGAIWGFVVACLVCVALRWVRGIYDRRRLGIKYGYLPKCWCGATMVLQNNRIQCSNCLRDEIKRLQDALLAYGAFYSCPGILVEEDMTSGCVGGCDCPTCLTMIAAGDEHDS